MEDFHNDFYGVVFFIDSYEIWFLSDYNSSNLDLTGVAHPAVATVHKEA